MLKDLQRNVDVNEFKWGLEHEFPVIKDQKDFCDFSNTTYEMLDAVIDELPENPNDYSSLRVGDLGIKVKRWYVEGFERFDNTGNFLQMIPKGMEIRTPVCNSLVEAIETLREDLSLWSSVAATYGYAMAYTSFNPFQSKEFIPEPPENDWERNLRAGTAEYVHMLTYGPDINISHPDLTAEDCIAIGQKLTYYSPFIVPFSFSSPFYLGKAWGGLSRRTYYRTGPRPVAAIFVANENQLINSVPALTKIARIPAEVGRIEFKSLDMVVDIDLYEALGTLLLGLVLDKSLTKTLTVPDQKLHQKSAVYGFFDNEILAGTKAVLDAAKAALPREDRGKLKPLEEMWEKKELPAHKMLKTYNETNSVLIAITK